MGFRIINVRYHKAKKEYSYYDGKIYTGNYYYRGFAVDKRNKPFEFFFTDDNIWEKKKISTQILYQEYIRHQQKLVDAF